MGFVEVSAFASLGIVDPWHTTRIAELCAATTATHVSMVEEEESRGGLT